jgi:Outer membrane protein beta-barrel domain
MKKVILCIFVLSSFGICVAQKAKFGVKGGINIANQIFGGSTPNPTPSSIIGYNIGALVEIKLSDDIALQPELFYSREGAKFNLTLPVNGIIYNTQNEFDIRYINLPLILKYYASKEFCLEFGPQIGFLTSADLITKVQGQSITQNAKTLFNSNDFGLNFGLSNNFNSNLFLQGRYNFGLSNIAKTESGDDSIIKNRVISFSLGYKFK